MKYVILHGDGMAGVPHEELGGQTPLQAAATPNMDALARQGELGVTAIQADSLVANSDVIEMALLGYDPRKWYPGPAPFEAAGQGIVVGEHDVVFRCNMVTLRAAASSKKGTQPEIKKLGPSVVMDDATAGGLDTEEARELIDAVNEQLGSETIQFYPGTGHRHLMVWVGGKVRATCVNPQDVIGRPISDALPTGDGADILRKLMDASLIILRDHPINDQRREAGLKPAHCLWLWGQGRAPQLPSLTEAHHVTGAIVSNSDVHRGIGICAGLEAPESELSAGAGDNDFSSLGMVAVHELGRKDLVYVHVQSPTQLSQETDPKTTIKMIEEFDVKVVGAIVQALQTLGPHRILLVCDRAASLGPAPGMSMAPYVIFQGPSQGQKSGSAGFSEAEADRGRSKAHEATKLLTRVLPRGSVT